MHIILINVVAWSLLAWIVLCWQGLPGRFRTWTSTTLLLAGLATLGVAPFLAGSYSPEVILFIAGNVHPVERIERSFGALAAGAGIVLLGLFALSRLGGRTPGKGPLAAVVKLTLAVLVLRIFLEKLGVPRDLALSFGTGPAIAAFAIQIPAQHREPALDPRTHGLDRDTHPPRDLARR